MAEDFINPDLPTSPYGVIWNTPGSRTYFVGTDRGMFYPEYGVGVPWNGLVSVEENPINGGIEPFYIDGIRRRNDHLLEEFAAKITAFSTPIEFGPCEGEKELAPGLYLGQQPRQSFGFSYRTFIGDDISVLGANYEVNIVYGAMVEPSSRAHKTMSGSPEPDTRSWDIATVPLDVQDSKPSARIRLDSRKVDPERLEEIQLILYGTPDILPRLPLIDEIYQILVRPTEEESEEIPWEPTE